MSEWTDSELYQVEVEVVVLRIFGRYVELSKEALFEVRRAIIEEVRKQELAGELKYKKGGE